MSNIKVALIQQSCQSNVAQNLHKSIAMIHQAASDGAQLVVLQELHRTYYFCQSENQKCFDLAEPIPGPTTHVFSSLAAELNIVIVASIFERRTAGIYHNTAVVLDTDGSIAGIYRKMHIPDDPDYYEKYYFTPGDTGFKPVQTSLGKIGILICWDQWFPEAARLLALAGAQILVCPTAIGWDGDDSVDEQQRQLFAWQTMQRSHAIANAIPLISANRTGFEKNPNKEDRGILFWGHSFIVGEQGETLAQASQDEEELLTGNVNFKRCEQVRQQWPFLRDRRIDAYKELEKRYCE
ncbi:MAG: carbon-nitrogen hydrolase [Mariprofundaceae bacterium]|nr:carbon-nitrogen hydrolase [Mariprofundaceae bacterium]